MFKRFRGISEERTGTEVTAITEDVVEATVVAVEAPRADGIAIGTTDRPP